MPTGVDVLRGGLRCGEAGCSCQRPRGQLHCPAHGDKSPSLSVREKNGRVLVHCFGGCSQGDVIEALKARGLWSLNTGPSPHVTRHEIRDLGGVLIAVHVRRDGPRGKSFTWERPDGSTGLGGLRVADLPLYGVHEVPPDVGEIVVCEGEKARDALSTAGFVAVGTVCGAGVTPSDETLQSLVRDGLRVILWPDADERGRAHMARIGAALLRFGAHDVRLVEPPDGVRLGWDAANAVAEHADVQALLASAKSFLIPKDSPSHPSVSTLTPLPPADELKQQAASVLLNPDPLGLVRAALPGCGYGGDLRPVLVIYLSMTSRVLVVRLGGMLAHLLLLALSSSGKNFALTSAMRFLPPQAYHVIDAGSPRTLIYDTADLRHRVVIFGEADSLPSGEDNPAASAIRNLLQDCRLHYKVVEREAGTGRFVVRTIDRPGPSVCITTAARRLGPQLETRFFVMEIPDDQQQIRAALHAQATAEIQGVTDPSQALVAYQGYLQALAPWDVLVPFADALAEAIGQSPSAPRVLRDYARLLSLIKAVAVLRHAHRARDSAGRLIAEIEDYATVHELVADIYAASTTGASRKVRETVEAVAALKAEGEDSITATAVAARLGVTKAAAVGRIGTALRGGWLVNHEERDRRPYRLALGEPLPPESGLPLPSSLSGKGVKVDTDGRKTERIASDDLAADDYEILEREAIENEPPLKDWATVRR
jgi:hypothetical protein